MEPRNRCQGINSASLCSLAGRYDNPVPSRCLAPIEFLYDNPIPTRFLAPKDCYKIPVLSFELYRQKLLAGKQQENSQIFNEDFYLPLYLHL